MRDDACGKTQRASGAKLIENVAVRDVETELCAEGLVAGPRQRHQHPAFDAARVIGRHEIQWQADGASGALEVAGVNPGRRRDNYVDEVLFEGCALLR